MNLYNATMKGILASEESRRRRLLEEMTAAAVRKAEKLGQNMSQVTKLDLSSPAHLKDRPAFLGNG